MNLALKQARKSLGKTSTNPSVGCIIVKNKCVLNSAHTGFGGKPHAENLALRVPQINKKNSLMYTTLEPCSHYGKTPPCVNSIIKSKIKKVFFSINDPDSRSFNKCKKKLNKYGIKVNRGLLSRKINIFYTDYKNKRLDKLPYVSAKLAVTKDYYSVNRKNKWITNLYSRGRVHLLRSEHDCILTSLKTIIKDNPMLNCRISGLEKFSPARIILDKELNIPLSSKIVLTSKNYKTIIFYNKIRISKIKKLKKSKIKCIHVELDNNMHLNLNLVLKKISKLGYTRIFLESGSNLIYNFLKMNLINKLYLFISNKKIKLNGRNSIKKIIKLLNFKDINFKEEPINLINDKLLIYKIK